MRSKKKRKRKQRRNRMVERKIIQHFIVVGVDNKGVANGVHYPWRGDIDWDRHQEGIICGIDEECYRHNIRNEYYIVIEYLIEDRMAKFSDECLMIRKGKVVFLSKKISRVQEWLEKRGQKYRGYYARIRVGDSEDIGVGNECDVVCGDNCNIKIEKYCNVDTGNDSTVIGDECSLITAGDNSKIKVSHGADIKVGRDSTVEVGPGSQVVCGGGSVIKWHSDYGTTETKINDSEEGKIFYGYLGKFSLLIEVSNTPIPSAVTLTG